MDVFNCDFGIIYFELEPPQTNDQLIEIINWLNNTKKEIRAIDITLGYSPMLELFMNTFRRNISQLTIFHYDGRIEYDDVVYKHLNFEIKNSFYSHPFSLFNLDFLLSMDTEKILPYRSYFSARELNIFLRSWQEGKTNQKLKEIFFIIWPKADVKEILKGCRGELMDPRTTRLKFREVGSDNHREFWIYGGIYIRRNDGHLAVIGGCCCREGENVSEYNIEEYLKHVEDWNSENRTWYVEGFRIFTF
uniref:FBA_2 domain-containing protein n=1 Tax=Caenorhabditis tropicalis TaxID=1561998 RepID=A0A1I7TTY5_9PELO